MKDLTSVEELPESETQCTIHSPGDVMLTHYPWCDPKVLFHWTYHTLKPYHKGSFLITGYLFTLFFKSGHLFFLMQIFVKIYFSFVHDITVVHTVNSQCICDNNH